MDEDENHLLRSFQDPLKSEAPRQPEGTLRSAGKSQKVRFSGDSEQPQRDTLGSRREGMEDWLR